jgi:hypothetical protein
LTDQIFTALPSDHDHFTAYGVKATPATRLLWDDDFVDLGDRRFEVIGTMPHPAREE